MKLLAEIESIDSEKNTARKAPGGFFNRLIDSRFLPLLTRLSRFLTERKVPSYIVGGFIRDMLLKRDTADIDIAVNAEDSLRKQIAFAVQQNWLEIGVSTEVHFVEFYAFVEKLSLNGGCPCATV